jgi:FkbM family methyltransferase
VSRSNSGSELVPTPSIDNRSGPVHGIWLLLTTYRSTFSNWYLIPLLEFKILARGLLHTRDDMIVEVSSKAPRSTLHSARSAFVVRKQLHSREESVQGHRTGGSPTPCVTIDWKGTTLRFMADQLKLSEIYQVLEETFVQQQYKRLSVEAKTVLDVGAFLGDSAIYFALQGARRVIAFEPDRRSASIANENFVINRLEDRVELINAAVGGQSGTVFVDETGSPVGANQLRTSVSGKEIQVISLSDILRDHIHPGESVAMKIDCEGCEYDLISSTPLTELARFDEIIMEYHHGTAPLRKTLTDAGFAVSILSGSARQGILHATMAR